ncbi:hypothetical protein J6590_095446 [Homalodisca vitripennis]|nr:hypothetical protein J6590_095446 [Homalodisca vitripennis]
MQTQTIGFHTFSEHQHLTDKITPTDHFARAGRFARVSPNPSQAVHTPHTKSNTQIQARPTVTPTFRDRVQQNTKPALSLEERKKLADKLKKNIQAKSENRSKFLVKKTNPSSSRSSQLSLDDDMVEDPLEMQTEFQTVQGNFRPVSKQRKKITMN